MRGAALLLLLLLAACGAPVAETPASPAPPDGSAPDTDLPAATPTEAAASPTAPADTAVKAHGLPSPVARDYEVSGFSYRALLPRDAIRPIYDPQLVPGEEAGYDPQELVLGVCIGDDCRAYPIGPLNWREMVNDEVGGISILATW